MKTFVIHKSEYMLESPEMGVEESKDLRTLLIDMMDWEDEGESLEEIKKAFEKSNAHLEILFFKNLFIQQTFKFLNILSKGLISNMNLYDVISRCCCIFWNKCNFIISRFNDLLFHNSSAFAI